MSAVTVRPLSQIGLIRVPSNAGARVHDPVPNKRTALDARNEGLRDRYLHPTKGYRRYSERRSVATLITEQLKAGQLKGYSSLMIRLALEAVAA